MHFSIALFAALCSNAVVCSERSSFSNATIDFTFDLLKTLSQTPGNVLFSPTSISVLLSILQQGARGATATELANILHADSSETLLGFRQLLSSTQVKSDFIEGNMATKLYANPNLEIGEEFKTAVVNYLDTAVENLQPDADSSAASINTWVKNATNGNIENIVASDALTEDLALVLVSAIYFKGKWEREFKDVRKEKFELTATTHKPVSFLLSIRNLTAGREPNYKWIELPYKGGKFSMYLIRPTNNFNHDLDGLLKIMNGDVLKKIINACTWRNVYLRLPKFKIKQKTPAKEALMKMGLNKMFTAEADLSGLGPSIKVSEILHEASLDVNEEGSEAAAATAIIIHTLSANWNPNDMYFRLDQPFLVFIVDKENGVPIFAGKIADPTA